MEPFRISLLCSVKILKFVNLGVDINEIYVIISFVVAGVAHLVERHLAKVEVASSSLVTRSINGLSERIGRFLFHKNPHTSSL